MNSLAIRFAHVLSKICSKSRIYYVFSSMVVRKRDNDCNADMNHNGERFVLEFLIEKNLLNVILISGQTLETIPP